MSYYSSSTKSWFRKSSMLSKHVGKEHSNDLSNQAVILRFKDHKVWLESWGENSVLLCKMFLKIIWISSNETECYFMFTTRGTGEKSVNDNIEGVH